MSFHPYLYFPGNCRAAFTRYQEVFGGELVLLSTKDMPSDVPLPEGDGDGGADLIMHAALRADGLLLMASDNPGLSVTGPDSRVQVHCFAADAADAQRIFAQLAEGGEVVMPIEETFWSPMFGACIDRFGIPWQVDVDVPSVPA